MKELITLIFIIIVGNGRLIFISLTSTNGDEYLILYYPIAYLLTYCMPWLFTKTFKYDEPIVKIFCRLSIVILFGAIMGIIL